MLLLALALSLVMGVLLGLLGGGGSILTLPLLIHVLDFDTKSAIAGSLFVVGVSSGVTVLLRARSGQVRWSTGLVFAIFAMAGAYCGGRVAELIPGWILMAAFIGMMVTTAFAMMRPKREVDASKPPASLALIATEGLLVGGFTGMVGAGGGFLVVPALVLLARIPLREAVATSLMVISLKSFAGLAGYLAHVDVDFGRVLPITVVAIVGALLGQWLANRVAPERLRTGFAYFVLIMAVYTGLSELYRAGLFESAPVWVLLAWTALAALLATIVVTRVLPRTSIHR